MILEELIVDTFESIIDHTSEITSDDRIEAMRGIEASDESVTRAIQATGAIASFLEAAPAFDIEQVDLDWQPYDEITDGVTLLQHGGYIGVAGSILSPVTTLYVLGHEAGHAAGLRTKNDVELMMDPNFAITGVPPWETEADMVGACLAAIVAPDALPAIRERHGDFVHGHSFQGNQAQLAHREFIIDILALLVGKLNNVGLLPNDTPATLQV